MRGKQEPIQPLTDTLRLKPQDNGTWLGLDGSIVVGGMCGNAESETYSIRLNCNQ